MVKRSRLEAALVSAADDPARRPEFYKILLQSTVFVLGQANQAPDARNRTMQPGESISLMHSKKTDGSPYIPFFGSLDSLRQAMQAETPYLELPARALFEMTSGTTLILNPGLPYGKEFVAAEIESLLATGANLRGESRTVDEPRPVQLGQPAEYPHQMVKALKALLPKYKSVTAAYLCLMHDPAVGPVPGLVVGIDSDGDGSKVMPDIGSVAADTAPKGVPVDLMLLRRGTEGVSGYLLEEVEPFYVRKRGTWLGRVRGG